MSDADDVSQILCMNVGSITPKNTCWTDSDTLGIQEELNLH